MKLEFSAGKFKLVAYTDGFPCWSKLSHCGTDIITGIHPDELRDLEYAARRMRKAIKQDNKKYNRGMS